MGEDILKLGIKNCMVVAGSLQTGDCHVGLGPPRNDVWGRFISEIKTMGLYFSAEIWYV